MLNIYEDIAQRTNGDIYIGVVGPVRTGKSTFIKRFMESVVIPAIDNIYRKERTKDELPQSGSGRTVMTTEPKFVPDDAVEIHFGDTASASVRMIDCVGYMVPGAEGVIEDGRERMVTTPWSEQAIPMTQAAEIGTYKVISEHSTIGIVISTDGSFGDIPRQDYLEAEERVIRELRAIGKPFVLILNSAEPDSENARQLSEELSGKYNVPCICLDCLRMTEGDIGRVMKALLYQFPLNEVQIWFPSWLEALPEENERKGRIYSDLLNSVKDAAVLADVELVARNLESLDYISECRITAAEAGQGRVALRLELPQELYYETISEQSGIEIRNDGDLMDLLRSMKTVKEQYDHLHEALQQAEETGYGLVMPTPEQMILHDPQIVSRGGHYSVKLKAGAPALHIIRTDVETEVSPAVGGEKASEEILGFLLQGFDGDVRRIWESNIFGKSLYDIAEEGLSTKLRRMPVNVQNRLRSAVQKVVNDGAYSIICIVI